MGRRSKIRILGEVPKLVNRTKTTIQVTGDSGTLTVATQQTIHRHVTGLAKIAGEGVYTHRYVLDRLGILTPKCRTCYEAYGFVSKCNCDKGESTL